MKHITFRNLCVAAACSSAFGLSSLMAQEGDEEPEEIFELSPFEVSLEGNDRYLSTNQIGGTRLQTPVQELPMSIQIVPDTLIKDMAVFEVEDAVRFVSGVSLNKRNDQDSGGENYIIRGFSTSMLLRNGIPFNSFTESVNVQQIEVVKGPSSVLYGVADPGGLINVVTKRPLSTKQAYFTTHVSSWEKYRSELDVTGPLLPDGKLAYRLMGSYESGSDWREYVDDEKTFYDGVISYQPNKRNNFVLEYMAGDQSQRSNSRRGYPSVRRRDGSRVFADLGVDFVSNARNDFQDLTQDLFEATWESQWTHNVKTRLAYTTTSRNADKYTNGGSTIQYRGDFGPDVYGETDYWFMNRGPQREIFDLDGENIYFDLLSTYSIGESRHTTLAGVQRRTESTSFANFTYDDGVMWDGSPGRDDIVETRPIRFYYDEEKDNVTGYDPTQSEEDRFWMPELDELSMLLVGGEERPYERETEFTGFFLSHQARFLDDKLRLMGGIRYDEMEHQKNDDFVFLVGWEGFDLAEHTFVDSWTPQLGVNYEIADGLSLYVAYNESFVPNTPQLVSDGNGGAKLEVYGPQEGVAHEAGIKYEVFDRKVVGTLAVFHIEKSNTVSYNKGRTEDEPWNVLSGLSRSEGVELDAVWSPSKNWQAIFAYAYHDAREVENDNIPGQVGYALQGAAKNNFSTWLRHQHTEGRLNGLSWGGGFVWKDGPINLFPNYKNADLTQGDYGVVDLFVSYSRALSEEVNMSWSFNLKNVTDKVYMDKTGFYADPRNFTTSLSLSF
ncbi:TonB-dependent siderophore receptor [Pelagicoccus mobilis]|uniref:TonB-dependent receptor n=1 Tax=Pelagicoccus mobilis TaxID=415221 RepID=A0A934RXC6_9BACT|nr:TonB-dependent receptor [Pelagicoccus mobilis]MBK1877200.1 TonB-dependent receptor [Pelagicoccus mobilis]